MPRIRLEAIRVPRTFLDPRRQERAIKNFLDSTAENIRIDLQVTVQTWKEKPTFKIEVTGEDSREISTDNLIYKFVSGGTKVRYATMTGDFIAKTRPGWIGSGAGRGGRAFVNKKKPMPGIKARHFPKVIIKKWKPRLPGLMRRMIAAEMGH